VPFKEKVHLKLIFDMF